MGGGRNREVVVREREKGNMNFAQLFVMEWGLHSQN